MTTVPRTALPASLLSALLLAGCWTPEMPEFRDDGFVGEQVLRSHAVEVVDGRVPEDELARLSLFVASLPPRYASVVTVNAGGPTADGDARSVVAALQRVQAPAAAVVYHRATPGPVLVTVQTTELLPRRCLQPDDGKPRLEVPPGCANLYNLTRMVEQPSDLLVGRPLGPSFSAPLAQAAALYLGIAEDGAPRPAATAPAVHTPPVPPVPPAGAAPGAPTDLGAPGQPPTPGPFMVPGPATQP